MKALPSDSSSPNDTARGIAHDMNNLLTVIRGYTQLCLDERDNRENRRSHSYLEQIAAAAERASSLNKQLLSLLKESEKQ